LLVTPQAKAQTGADPRFQQAGLRAAVQDELRRRQLLDEGGANRTLQISIADFGTHPTSNAVLFGYQLSAGTLDADVTVRGADGAELQDFRIQASSRLSTRADEPDANPLGALYRRFAVLTADHLAGVPTKPESQDQIPR
ncbi:MAG: hypothetical protein WB440_09500, partial [Steroidobacteraceae bacterium]